MQAVDQASRAAELAWYFETFPRFCSLLPITTKDGSRLPSFKLNAIQKLFCLELTGRDVVLKPRQIGFTTLILALDVYKFLTVRGARVVIVCQSMTGNAPVKILAGVIKRFFTALRAVGVDLAFTTETNNEWAIADRDASLRIIVAGASEASAAKVGRSGTITHCHLTEIAFWEFAEDTLNALLECVPGPEHGSSILFESTPNGASGYFYRQCLKAQAGSSGYKLHFYPWFEAREYALPLEPGEHIEPENDRERLFISKGITLQQLKWYRRKVAENGQDRTDQEYPSDPETCFLISGRGFFDQTVTSRLLTKIGTPIETRKSGRIRIYEKPVESEDYVFALDCSEGVGGDPSGGIMYKRANGQHVATLDGQFQPHDGAAVAVELCKEYHGALLAPERNNHGHAVLQAVRTIGYNRVYRHDDDKRGWNTNVVSRPVMLDSLEDAHRRGLWTTPDGALLAQMRKFIINDSGKAEAARGEHDDLVIAAAIGWAVRQRKSIRGAIAGDLANVL